MKVADITSMLERWAPRFRAADYDNPNLYTGSYDAEVRSILLSLDCTEAVVQEAIDKGVDMIICHHPLIFKGLKAINGKNDVERAIIKAIKNDIAIYGIHTNLDATLTGVNYIVAQKLGLVTSSLQLLDMAESEWYSLTVFCPPEATEAVKDAIFQAGAGHIGAYDNCSFEVQGTGQYRPLENANPYFGSRQETTKLQEHRLECIVTAQNVTRVIAAMKSAHPYEEVAYYLHHLANKSSDVGYGIVGDLPEPMEEDKFFDYLKQRLSVSLVRYTRFLGKPIKRVAFSGGTCSLLIPNAIAAQADIFITADIKYHEFFLAEGKIILADINHFESEQFTPQLIAGYLSDKIANIAVFFSETNTNPILYR